MNLEKLILVLRAVLDIIDPGVNRTRVQRAGTTATWLTLAAMVLYILATIASNLAGVVGELPPPEVPVTHVYDVVEPLDSLQVSPDVVVPSDVATVILRDEVGIPDVRVEVVVQEVQVVELDGGVQ